MDANGREQDANQDASNRPERPGRWVTVPEAAAALGVQPRAIQKRIQADRLRSRPDGRRLLVWIEEQKGDAAPQEQDANGTRPSPEVREPDASEDAKALVAQLRSENALLKEQDEKSRSEIAFLRIQLEARTSAEAEFRRLLLYSQDQQRAGQREIEGLWERLAITAGQRSPQERGEIGEAAPVASGRPWWAFWRRGV